MGLSSNRLSHLAQLAHCSPGHSMGIIMTTVSEGKSKRFCETLIQHRVWHVVNSVMINVRHCHCCYSPGMVHPSGTCRMPFTGKTIFWPWVENQSKWAVILVLKEPLVFWQRQPCKLIILMQLIKLEGVPNVLGELRWRAGWLDRENQGFTVCHSLYSAPLLTAPPLTLQTTHWGECSWV